MTAVLPAASPSAGVQSGQAGQGGSCGTYAGWNIHQRQHTRPCRPCQLAHNAYMREYRHRDVCAAGLGWPLRHTAVTT